MNEHYHIDFKLFQQLPKKSAYFVLIQSAGICLIYAVRDAPKIIDIATLDVARLVGHFIRQIGDLYSACYCISFGK
jgi:hypothetical protein